MGAIVVAVTGAGAIVVAVTGAGAIVSVTTGTTVAVVSVTAGCNATGTGGATRCGSFGGTFSASG